MEKDVIRFIFLILLITLVCSLPVFFAESKCTYTYCRSLESVPVCEQIWQFSDGYILKNCSVTVPGSVIIKEYKFTTDNIISMKLPHIQYIAHEGSCVIGIPYIID